jgi:hypothetical protein
MVVQRQLLTRRIAPALVVVAAGAGVTLLAAGGAARRSSTPRASSVANLTISATHRPRRPGDALSRRLISGLDASARRTGAAGVEFATARRVAPAIWLVVARRVICMHLGSATSGTTTCAPTAAVARGGPMVSGQFRGSPPFTAGVVPDGVSTVTLRLVDGSTRTVRVVGNTYYLSTTSSADAVSFRTRRSRVVAHFQPVALR